MRNTTVLWCVRPQEHAIRTKTTEPVVQDPAPFSKRDHLRATLPATVDLLQRRRADLIGDDVIEEFVALNWLEWNGGALRLTVTGQNVCQQLKTPL
jgi:hypothetical protein